MSVLKTYGDKLKDPRWQKLRLQVMERDKFTCRCCRDTETTLNIHHLEYAGEPWECPIDKLLTLCENCHEIVSTYGYDLRKNDIEITRVNLPAAKAYLLFDELAIWIYLKVPGQPIMYKGEMPHQVARYLVHDIINYWLKSDREHYLTEKLDPNGIRLDKVA